ncbi:MAG TPA: M1 family metallopeptidase, partial [Flavobacteriaceae bacterium]|nr:M1 family metallopeptidase [Flavobacteriaceae bacterium]
MDFLRLHADLDLIPAKESLSGKVVIEFKILKNIDVVFLDAKNMQASLAPDSKVEATLSMDADKLWIKHNFVAGRTYEISFLYTAEPKQTLYFTGWNDAGSNQVFTQGQGKETSHWLPSIDDLNEKIEFDLSITAPKNYRVIANGKLVDSTSLTGKTRWEFDMEKPMSSYLVALAIGDFQYKTIYSQSDIPIKLFYEAKDSLKVETTYLHSGEIFDFLEKEIGVDFPWKIYKQVPVRDFLYAGMENTTLTIFSEAFVIDSVAFIDRNYVNVNAHELAHQWFGNLVTEKSSTHHWLQEGFATYYALLAEKEIFGDDYFYFKLYQSAESLKARSDKGEGEAVLNPKAGSLTFYQKGAWALHILREKIGAEAFREAV